ncbi:hypothetical protein BCV69DRAFT_130509 [Microstroma glucosiphilum]|uniref:Fungal-type protein kinase domain-containing protein n=1 Tax=Pseudomicrostroma glucosiphilum TaxID=1684307 RepID=A0A316TW11_9BASI|nr:hypothetical protein BCV69DRAFT_130509 [Pseudomicrostroma glucosiphilum]PWN17706.1 hypothetical protein BCV69DRAFT_130509 [Pseudomicrostroma glucosiphilum]
MLDFVPQIRCADIPTGPHRQRRVCQYRAPISHFHFLTWCGHKVRLWYLNASTYAASLPFDTRVQSDQVELVKILRLISLEEHSALLAGQWHITAQTEFHIEVDGDNLSLCERVTNAMQPLERRPGPFGSQTAVFAEGGGARDEPVLMIKISWLAPHLLRHELAMMRTIQKLGLPYAPVAYGMVVIPTTGFQGNPCEELDISSSRSRVACALLTKQHIGDRIGAQCSPRDVLSIHMQLVDVLFKLAKGNFHYRDLNTGNVRVLQGHTDILLLVDLGNMRSNFSPRERPEMTYAEAMLDRATDDTRSANVAFLPTCCLEVKNAIELWAESLHSAQRDFQAAINRDPSHGVQSGLQRISATLEVFRSVLKTLALHSHRYIDDLESALYLHVWTRACNYHANGNENANVENLGVLVKQLCDLSGKRKAWKRDASWHTFLNKYCPRASDAWTDLMRELRTTIYDAREELNRDLADHFDAINSLKLDSLQDRLTRAQWELGVEVKDIIVEVFGDRGIAEDTGLHDVERRCFEKCSSLMRAAVASGQEM